MANPPQKDTLFHPDWRDRICDEKGRIRDEGTRQDYNNVRRETNRALTDSYERQARDKAAQKNRQPTGDELRQAKRDATRDARDCVDSMDWQKHQAARSNPDPQARGQITVEHDFSRDQRWEQVSRSEMNRTADKGVCSSLKKDGVNYVGLGNEDQNLKSDQVHDHFALPRAKENEPRGNEQRSGYRVSYKLDKDGVSKGNQFALRDDCSGGTWTVKDKDGTTRQYHREGGGQQAVIIQGGEHFKAQTEKDQILAHNRETGQPDKIKWNPDDPAYGKAREEAVVEPKEEAKSEPKAAAKMEPAPEAKAQPKAESRAEPFASSPEKSARRLEREAKYAQQGKGPGDESGKDPKGQGEKGNSTPRKEER